MRNDHLFLHWARHRLAVLAALALTIALPLAARADVDAVPPNQINAQTVIAGTPHRNTVNINSTTNHGNGITSTITNGQATIRLPPNHFGGSTNTSGTIHGVKTNPVHGVDSYGNRATGQIRTSTNVGTVGGIGKAGTTLIAASLASAIVNSPGAKTAAQQLALGNYGHAAAGAVAALDVTGLGSGVYGLIDIYQTTSALAEMRQNIKLAAEEKAQAAAQRYDPNLKDDSVRRALANGGSLYSLQLNTYGNEPYNVGLFSETLPKSTAMFVYHHNGQKRVQASGDPSLAQYAPLTMPYVQGQGTPWASLGWKLITAEEIAALPHLGPPPTLEDFLLSNLELQNLIASYLDRNLAQNEALATAITNMLWQSGQLNPGNTQTVVMGTPSENTFITAPYTPAGSNQAQQTQFVVNPNGTVTTSYIPRPDLGAHTSQAPTRSLVGGNKGGTTGSTGTTTGGSTGTGGTTTTPKLPDDEDGNVEICDQDDEGKIVCLEAGSDDYEDLAPAADEQRLEFRKQTPFSTNGRCPADAQFQFLGHSFSFSYYAVCRIAELVSPMIELLGIVVAAGIAYGAVREL